jgi:PAS domain S-box-containing protein
MLLNGVRDERDEYFCRMADAMPHMVWTTDLLGQVEYLNQPWVTYTGLSVSESLGTGWLAVVDPADVDAFLKIREQRYCHGLPVDVELRLRRADGEYRWHTVRSLPLRDGAGETIKYVGSATDIHVTKQSQLSLQNAVNEVERQVKERTAELLRTNMELIDAISQRRRAMSVYERDAQRLNEIISTQSLLTEAKVDFEAFLNLAVQKIEHLTEASGAAFELLEGDHFVTLAASDLLARQIGMRFALEGSLSGLCISSRSVLTSGDIGADTRIKAGLAQQIETVSMVVAPLFCRGRSVGVVKIVSREKNAFGERDVQTLRLMAGLIGSAIGQQPITPSTKKKSKRDETKSVNLKL